jgi:hypothetical protein
MKKKTVITTETHEVWVIRQPADMPSRFAVQEQEEPRESETRIRSLNETPERAEEKESRQTEEKEGGHS